MELQGDFNPDNSIAETKLELALSKLKLLNKKNQQKLMEDIALCEVKNGVPIINGKKIVQLIRLGRKTYGTVITVTQMPKKSKKVTCTRKHIVDKIWKQWRIKLKEKGKIMLLPTKKPLIQKLMTKSKRSKKVEKERMTKARRKRAEETLNFKISL
jgi:hypothetical protein